jgi:hypothetical protein
MAEAIKIATLDNPLTSVPFDSASIWENAAGDSSHNAQATSLIKQRGTHGY